MLNFLSKLRFGWNMTSVLTVSMVLIIALFMAVDAELDIRRERANLRERIEERSQLLTNSLSEHIVNVVRFPELHSYNEVTSLAVTVPDIAYIRIFTRQGGLLSQEAEESYKPLLDNLAPLGGVTEAETTFQFGEDIFQMVSPIEIEGQTVAFVQAGFHNVPRQGELRSIVANRMLKALIFILIAVPISYLTAQYFVRPIRKLARAAEQISKGNIDVHIPIDSRRGDEVGELAASFSEMTKALAASRNQYETLVKEERQKAAHFKALKEIAEFGLTDRPRNELLQSLLEKFSVAYEADGGTIFLYDKATDHLELIAQFGVLKERKAQPGKYNKGVGVLSKVLSENNLLVVEDVQNSTIISNAQLKEAGIRTMVGSPLRINGKPIGAVFIHYLHSVKIDETQISMIELMAERLAAVIERAHLLEQEREQAVELVRINETNRVIMQELEVAQERNVQAAKMAAIGQLSGGIAHEINNPLASILGFSQLAQHKLSALRDKELTDEILTALEKYNSNIEKEAHRTAEIVSKMRSFGNRRVEGEPRPIDVNELVEQALRLTNNQIAITETKVERNLSEEALYVGGDGASLIQVFSNIIMNATRAMPDSGTLTVTTRVAQPYNSDDRRAVEILFKDTGVGMSEDILTKVFDPFFTTAEPGDGTGLGLYVCYQTARSHDGDIYVESREGEGSIFTVRLPAVEAPELASAPAG